MYGIFTWIGSGLKTIGQSLALPFIKIKTSSRWQWVARWILHGLCVLGIVACLAYLNYALRLDSLLLAPISSLRNFWLPTVFLQLYVISWLGWWLCQMLTSKSEVSQHPEIEKAWSKVETALQRADVDLSRTPLFLLIGKPEDATANFLNAGKVVRSVTKTPADDDAPFHVYAGEEGIYVCCEGTSLLGRQAQMFARAKKQAGESGGFGLKRAVGGRPGERAKKFLQPVVPHDISLEPGAAAPAFVSSSESASALSAQGPTAATLDPDRYGGVAQAELPRTESPQVGSAGDVPKTAEASMALIESNIALLEQPVNGESEPLLSERIEKPETYQAARKLVMPLLQNEAEIETTTSRLSCLCTLIKRARSPFCSVNGVVVLIPFCSSENQNLANHTGLLIEQDLQAISDATQIDAPRIAVFCDLQQATGCVDLLDRFPEQQRHRRLGIKFPKIPACDRSAMNQMIVEGISWLSNSLIPPVVNRLFQTERAGNRTHSVNQGNQRLYQFMFSIRQRQSNFERIIRRAFLGNRQPGELLRGCYFAATGRDAISEQGFTAGIFSQLFELQNDVRWTDEAVRRDQDLRRWTWLGYAGVTIVTAGVLFSLFV